jgi:hypothetical protein
LIHWNYEIIEVIDLKEIWNIWNSYEKVWNDMKWYEMLTADDVKWKKNAENCLYLLHNALNILSKYFLFGMEL